MGEVVAFKHRSVFGTWGIQPRGVEEFLANMEREVRDPNDPDRRQDIQWFDTNAPGWTVEGRAIGYFQDHFVEREFIRIEVAVIFPDAASKRAWDTQCAEAQAAWAAAGRW